MQTIKCPECGQKIISWNEFPKNLHATVSCSNGVIQWITQDEYEEFQYLIQAGFFDD